MTKRLLERSRLVSRRDEDLFRMAAPTLYRIRVQGHLRTEWSDWFEGMTITWEENGESELFGLVSDQPALHGLLAKVRDLGLVLISVNRVEPVVPLANNDQAQDQKSP